MKKYKIRKGSPIWWAKYILAILIAIIGIWSCLILATSAPSYAATKTNKTIAVEWAHDHYPSRTVKVVGYYNVPYHKHGVVYVERIPTRSKGGYNGRTPDGYFVKYAKKVKKGKKEICYSVWAPKGNDVVAFVSCKKVK